MPYFLKARELGAKHDDITQMVAQGYFDGGKIDEGIAEISRLIDEEKAAGRAPLESWYSYVIARLNQRGDRAGIANWMMREVRDLPTLANWRKVIVTYRNSLDTQHQPLSRDQKIDLYRLMRGTGALVDLNDYVEYAQEAINGGLPWEALTVLDAGRKAGKIPAGDPDAGGLTSSANNGVRNEGSLETLAKQAATDRDGKGLAATADAFFASGDYARAIQLYDAALPKGGVDADTINLRRGAAMVFGGQKDQARVAFALVKAGPNGDIARFWLAWMDLPPLS